MLLYFYFFFNVLFYVWDICVGFCQLAVLFCTSTVLGLHSVIHCNPVCSYTEGKHVLFALSASVPPSALGRLQVYSHRLWILLHVQHHRLPHWLWNPVPAGELQLQDGSHAWYDLRKTSPMWKCGKYLCSRVVVYIICVFIFTFMLFQTGTSTVCTPEQYKDCADPALGEPTDSTA